MLSYPSYLHRLAPGLLIALTVGVPSGGCLGAPAQPEAQARSEAIVYGEDDRTDVYLYPDPLYQDLARNSMVALIEPDRLLKSDSGALMMDSRSLGYENGLCGDQRFAQQPTAADCSGVLIDEDLVLTAGHCFDTDDACDRYAYVFDYYYEGENRLAEVTDEDVYGCRTMVSRRVSPLGAPTEIDYAIVQLERPVGPPRRPAPIRTTSLTTGEPLVVIGYTSGVPAKIDDGSQVVDTRAEREDYFRANSDTFAGSSGSGAFDADGSLVGILVRGGVDYQLADGLRCFEVNVIPEGDNGEPWEHMTYVGRGLDALCDEAQWPSQALCNAEPVCGDGVCSPNEAGGTCAHDCEPSLCLGRRCGDDAHVRCEGEGCTLGQNVVDAPQEDGGEPIDPGPAGGGGGCRASTEGAASAWWWAAAGLLLWRRSRH